MKYLLILLTFVILTTNTVSAQQDFFLKSKKSGRLKKLRHKTNFSFEVITTDSSKRLSYFGRIIQMTDSTLTIEEYVKPSLRRGAITLETWTIEIKSIKSVKNYLIDDDDFNTLGGMVIICGALAVISTPIIWIAEGKEKGQQAALISVGLFAVGGLLLLPQFIGKQRQMTKWEFVRK
jgi:uncharacterized membrane protein